jgi:hypothetical protein
MTAAAPVKLDDLLTAVEWVSGEGTYDHSAYVSRTTGGIHIASAGGGLDEELPADVDDERLYVEVPSRSDLDLGRNLVLRFVEAKMPDAYNQIRAIFS